MSGLRVVSIGDINAKIAKDDIKIAEMLQWILESSSYKREIPTLPQEHAFAVLNLTHYAREIPMNQCKPLAHNFLDPRPWVARQRDENQR